MSSERDKAESEVIFEAEPCKESTVLKTDVENTRFDVDSVLATEPVDEKPRRIIFSVMYREMRLEKKIVVHDIKGEPDFEDEEDEEEEGFDEFDDDFEDPDWLDLDAEPEGDKVSYHHLSEPIKREICEIVYELVTTKHPGAKSEDLYREMVILSKIYVSLIDGELASVSLSSDPFHRVN